MRLLALQGAHRPITVRLHDVILAATAATAR
eukprot:CAMPEP_0115831986 /NCGR_PEP_ID=MMETSP0287-20121206/2419_1 /TAXON_ID=412157 /ORGANISM="Chrysochromulina rotalis, Strain UIO044" /LENGTH=30 /DNA_ID= /DNA_START= /DNA_END= /DNA_ORIENTATION=